MREADISDVQPITKPAPAKPGKRAARKARTRRHIYEAAMKLFAARGYDNVTIEEICAEAGVAKATFFLHFAGKVRLIEEFNARLVERIASELETAPGGAEARLRTVIEVCKAQWRDQAEVMMQMAREFFSQPALMSAAEAANRDLLDLVESIIAEGQATGELVKDVPARLTAVALVSTWSTIASHWTEAHGAVDVNEIHEDIMKLMLGGLRPRTA